LSHPVYLPETIYLLSRTQPQVIRFIHRPRKVFESGGQIVVMTNGGACAPTHGQRPCWSGCGMGSYPPTVGVRVVLPPENFGNFMWKMGHIGEKLHISPWMALMVH